MDRIAGFGPVDLGSNPSRPILSLTLLNDLLYKKSY